jgi:hypothetical protein
MTSWRYDSSSCAPVVVLSNSLGMTLELFNRLLLDHLTTRPAVEVA